MLTHFQSLLQRQHWQHHSHVESFRLAFTFSLLPIYAPHLDRARRLRTWDANYQHTVEKFSENERSGSKHRSRNEDDDESLSQVWFDNLFAHVPTRLVGVPRNLDPCHEETIESSARIGGGSVAGMDCRNSIWQYPYVRIPRPGAGECSTKHPSPGHSSEVDSLPFSTHLGNPTHPGSRSRYSTPPSNIRGTADSSPRLAGKPRSRCEQCQITFSDSSIRRRHDKRLHRPRTYKWVCSSCHSSFGIVRYNCLEHIRNHHAGTVDGIEPMKVSLFG
jgi:hypothetical protein